MKNLELQQRILGMVCTNCYFLKNKQTGEMLIVDPADQPQAIQDMVSRMGGTPMAILLTHGHYDHIMAANEIKDAYEGVKIYAGKAEERMLADPALNLSGHYSVEADVFLEDGEHFQAAGFDITYLYTPGHTSGSGCYYIEEEQVLLSGDTLFCESVGRSDLPTGSTRELMDSLHKLLELLPDEVDVFPGHESMTTIAHEKRYNPFV